MAMTYTCTLTCGACKAALTFTDERPAWKTYDYRVEMADECERAARFVAEHLAGLVSLYDHSRNPMGERRLCLTIPEPYRYVDCPVCDAHIREPA